MVAVAQKDANDIQLLRIQAKDCLVLLSARQIDVRPFWVAWTESSVIGK